MGKSEEYGARRSAVLAVLLLALLLSLVPALVSCGSSSASSSSSSSSGSSSGSGSTGTSGLETEDTDVDSLSELYDLGGKFAKSFDKAFKNTGANNVEIEENTVVLTFVLGDYVKNKETEAICRKVVEEHIDTAKLEKELRKISKQVEFDVSMEYRFINEDGEVLYSKFIEVEQE